MTVYVKLLVKKYTMLLDLFIQVSPRGVRYTQVVACHLSCWNVLTVYSWSANI